MIVSAAQHVYVPRSLKVMDSGAIIAPESPFVFAIVNLSAYHELDLDDHVRILPSANFRFICRIQHVFHSHGVCVLHPSYETPKST